MPYVSHIHVSQSDNRKFFRGVGNHAIRVAHTCIGVGQSEVLAAETQICECSAFVLDFKLAVRPHRQKREDQNWQIWDISSSSSSLI